MQIIKHYRHDPTLRASFNRLAEKTFGLNFENWYQNGFWGDNYDPYSVVVHGEVVANVSLNRTDMVIDGAVRRFYQLGTVMTEENYRNRGYIREIMAQIEKDTQDADGVYLFGNDSVLNFYPKFGFVPGVEHTYFRPVSQIGPDRMKRVPMDGPESWARLSEAMEKSQFSDSCHMTCNPGLIFFYVSQFMTDCVYYDAHLDAWVVAELEDGCLTIHNVFAGENVSLSDVIAGFGSQVKQVELGFTPADPENFQCRIHKEDECTFFIKGEGLSDFAGKKLRIPSLSHA